MKYFQELICVFASSFCTKVFFFRYIKFFFFIFYKVNIKNVLFLDFKLLICKITIFLGKSQFLIGRLLKKSEI